MPRGRAGSTTTRPKGLRGSTTPKLPRDARFIRASAGTVQERHGIPVQDSASTSAPPNAGPNGGLAAGSLQGSERDIRRKRPPALSFLLRISTLGRTARVLSLLALDFAAVALAIFTALVLKEAAHGELDVSHAAHG